MNHHKRHGDSEPFRGYLGASIIGESCARRLWYTFRACCKEDFPGRLYRLFETGDLEEVRMTAELRAIGCEVHDVNPATGEQFEITHFGGHFSGHMDGCALGLPEAPKTWHVTEYKTHNAKSYAELAKNGVQASKPKHYAQMQIYMHKTGMKRAYYLAKNKDTDELYSERVHYDKAFCEQLIEKARWIIFSNDIPPRLSERPDWWECKFCPAHALCHQAEPTFLPLAEINCRQCCHATPKEDGDARWFCEKDKRSLSADDQSRSCNEHLLLPALLDWATPIDHGKTHSGHPYIVFERNDNQVPFTHGGGGFSTAELVLMTMPVLESKMVNSVRDTFDAKVTEVVIDNPLSKYAPDACRTHDMGIADLTAYWMDRYEEDFASLIPLSVWDTSEYKAAEFSGERLVISWNNVVQEGSKVKIQIREGIK